MPGCPPTAEALIYGVLLLQRKTAGPEQSSASGTFSLMIVRTWVAYAKPGNARAYREHLKGSVLPQLRKLDGFVGLSVCEAELGTA